MNRKAKLVFYKGLDGWVTIGEIEVFEDGSFTGQIRKSDVVLGLPEIITKSNQPFVFAMNMLPSVSEARILRLKSGNWQFGHSGMHVGIGSSDCPQGFHHHHDEFCDIPTEYELAVAGIDPKEFKVKRRN